MAIHKEPIIQIQRQPCIVTLILFDFDTSLSSTIDISYKPLVASAKQSPLYSHLFTGIRRTSTRENPYVLGVTTSHPSTFTFSPLILP